jgi:hypothetical protein
VTALSRREHVVKVAFRSKPPAMRRRSLLLALVLRPFVASPLAALWLRSSGSVIKQGWILSPDD